MHGRVVSVASLFALLGAVIAGCGDDDADSDAPTTSAAAPASPSATDAPSSSVPTSTAQSPATTGGDMAADAEWQAIVDAANAEGEVTLYGSATPDQLAAVEKAFEQAYPEIDMTFVRLTSVEAEPKLDVERESGQAGADLYMHNDTVWENRNLGEDPTRLVDFAGPDIAALDAKWRLLDGKAFIHGFATVALAWNPSEVSQPITGVEGLLDPALKGRIGMVEPSSPYAPFVSYLKEVGGEDFLGKLAEQDLVFYPATPPMLAALTAGEIAAVMYASVNFAIAEETGAPIEFALPQDHPIYAAPFVVSQPAWAKHPNAAQVLANFLVTMEGSRAFVEKGREGLVPMIDLGDGGATPDDLRPNLGTMTADEVEAAIEEFNTAFGR